MRRILEDLQLRRIAGTRSLPGGSRATITSSLPLRRPGYGGQAGTKLPDISPTFPHLIICTFTSPFPLVGFTVTVSLCLKISKSMELWPTLRPRMLISDNESGNRG